MFQAGRRRNHGRRYGRLGQDQPLASGKRTRGHRASRSGTAIRAEGFKTLYSFTGGAAGGTLQAGVIRDPAGNLYGTTSDGGDLSCSAHTPYGCGTVFKIDPSGAETTLWTFTGPGGGYSYAPLIRDQAGNFYGTTGRGRRLLSDIGGVNRTSERRAPESSTGRWTRRGARRMETRS